MHSYSLCHANMTKIHGSHNMIAMKFYMKTGNGRLVNTIVPPTVRRVATDARSIIPVESKALGWIWSTSGCGCIFRCWFLLSDVSTFNEHCQRTQAERCNQLDCRVSESCQPYCGFSATKWDYTFPTLIYWRNMTWCHWSQSNYGIIFTNIF